MELPIHIKEIRDQLLADDISWSDALNSLQEATKRKKPWHYKEWKQERDMLIKDCCAQCGQSNDSAQMVLQHLWHPSKISDIFEQLAYAEIQAKVHLKEKYIEHALENSAELKNMPIGNREACPKCESTNVRFRKTWDKWACISNKSRRGRVVWRCGNVFETPLMKQEPNPDEKREIASIKQKIQYEAYLKFNKEIKESYGKQVVLESIKETERYLSLRDTVTFCKKCAYLMDVKKLALCPNCKDYLPIWHVDTCSDRHVNTTNPQQETNPEQVTEYYLSQIKKLLT